MSSGIFTCSRDRPDDFKGYGYFYALLYCTGLGFQANIVEEYVPLSASQLIFAGLKRTRDQELSSALKARVGPNTQDRAEQTNGHLFESGLLLCSFTKQVLAQLDLLRCGHELRPAGVHRWLQVAAIETAVSKQTSSFPNGQFQHHHSSVVLVLMCSLSLLVAERAR